LSVLAYHFTEAAGADVAKAVHYGVLAGRRALEQLAYEEAATHFERTLQALDLADQADDAKRTELLLALGDARDRAGDRDAARTAYDAALTLARATDDGDAFGRAAIGWIGVWLPAAVRPEGIVVLEEALERLAPGDSATRSRVMTKLAQEAYFADDLDHVRTLHSESIDMARRLGDPGAIAYALGFFANYAPLENPEEWGANAREAIVLGERARDAAAIQNARMALMWNLVEMGAMDEFDRELEAAEVLATAVHLPVYAWYVPLWKSTRATMRGQISLAESYAVESLTMGSGSDELNALQMFGVQLFAIRREQGRTAELDDGIRGMIAQYPMAPAWRAGLALSLAERGEFDTAASELDVFIHDGVDNFRRDGNWAIAQALVVDTWELLGDHNAQTPIAYEVLKPFAHRFISVGWAADAYGSVERLLGVLAGLLERWDEAEAHFLAGFEADGRTGGIRGLVRGHLQLARMYQRRGADGDADKAGEVARAGLEAAAGIDLPVLTQGLALFI
jgi:tetratricopeptide (TPR) repeat protein